MQHNAVIRTPGLFCKSFAKNQRMLRIKPLSMLSANLVRPAGQNSPSNHLIQPKVIIQKLVLIRNLNLLIRDLCEIYSTTITHVKPLMLMLTSRLSGGLACCRG